MMFRFPLQRLLDLKAKREQEMARQLAAAQQAADQEQRVRDTLASQHADAHRHIAATTSGAATVGEITSLSYTLAQLAERITMADERTHAASQAVEARHGELSAALQERQVLDRLRDKRLEMHRSEENARDRQTMDDIAIGRFASKKNTPNEGQEA